MLFNSIDFIILLVVTFCLYYLQLFRKQQVVVLILSSLFFYAYNQPALLLLLLWSITINTIVSYAIVYKNDWGKKSLAITGVVLNLSGIAFFKYSGLLIRTFAFQNTDIGHFLILLPLPIGISFFTFEGITLVVDTFRNKKTNEYASIVVRSYQRHLSNTMLFISFFPHLIAGPILKAHDFYAQIGTKKISDINWDKVFGQLVVGYFLKMVVADNLKDFTFEMTYPYFERFSNIELLTLLFGYSMQIFADFAGYSLIAVGLGGLFGYRLPNNFNFPYIASSFSEFWQRWHISLSSFLREYLYIPLGGNKKGKVRTYLNLMIVMALGGLWHGASWSYMVWGTFHGLALALERFLSNLGVRSESDFYRLAKGFWVFVLVSFAWLLFRLHEFGHAIEYIRLLFVNTNISTDFLRVYYIALLSLPVIAYHILPMFNGATIGNFKEKLKPVMLGAMICSSY